MTRRGTVPLVLALIHFIAFFANVASGAAGMGVVLGDLAEMLTLLASSVFFVAGILLREAEAKSEADT